MNLCSASEQNLYWAFLGLLKKKNVVRIRNLSAGELSWTLPRTFAELTRNLGRGIKKRVAGQHLLHMPMAPGSAPPNLELLDCALVNIPVAHQAQPSLGLGLNNGTQHQAFQWKADSQDCKTWSPRPAGWTGL